MERRVVVLGGTGFIGRAYAWRCAAQGLSQHLTIPTRAAARRPTLWPNPNVMLVDGDVHDNKVLGRVMAGAEAVVNLVGILHGRDTDFQRVHIDLPLRIGELARDYDVPHVVHVSALGAATDAPSMYLRSKAAGEAALQRCGVPLSVIRPSVVFGAEDRLLNLFARLQALLPVVPLAGANARLQPVWVRDLAQALWTCVERGPGAAGVYEAVGPHVLTLRELVRCAGQLSGHVRPVWALPPALAALQAWVLEHLPGPKLMSRDNLRSLQVDAVASGRFQTLQALGIVPASIEQAHAQESGDRETLADLQRWRAAPRVR
ncbi:MAG: complex I NDUFA9 subunit family protein [Burkholderiaceae bacterium]|nr:complex I NDUFA9 subunit family protein [Burkholderiaceae bacterium]